MAIAVCAVLAGCTLVAPPSPSGVASESSVPGVVQSAEPISSGIPVAQLVGDWRAAPLQLGDPQIAVVSDACAAAARTELGSAEADLPTAIVDARGEGFTTAILADETRAIQCLGRIDGAGAATIDSIERLAPSAVAPVADGKIGLTSLVPLDDRNSGRMYVLGRVGPNATELTVQLDDKTVVTASIAGGWYSAWWPRHPRATAIDAVDGGNPVVRAVAASGDPIDGRLGAAAWWLDPDAPAPGPTSTSIQTLVLEEACASGKSAKDRVELPLIDLSETAVTVTFGIRPLSGSQDCQGNDPFPLTFQLPEPLANRTLLDGNEVPPRDASKPPVG
jgi:hypothetical protein